MKPVSCAPALPSEEHGDGQSQGTPGCENEHFGESESDMLTSNGDLVVAVHPELGSDLTDNHTGQRLVGRRVPQLKKIKSIKLFFVFFNNNVSQPGREKGEPLDLGQG